MKRFRSILFVIMIVSMLLPIGVLAEDRRYVTMDFKETLDAENIELENKEYKENDNQITIYLFRGNKCSVCHKFLSYLNSISESHGKKFKLVSYEVWSNEHNGLLFEETAAFFGKQAKGVPFIVIGDKCFDGYIETYNDDILKAIDELYNSEERYDVFVEMEKKQKKEYKNQFFDSGLFFTICTVNISIFLFVIFCLIIFENIRYKKLQNQIDVLVNQIESLKKQIELSIKDSDNHHKEKKVNNKKER